MALFKFKAFTADKKLQEGLVEAGNREEAEEILKEKNLSIVSLKEAGLSRKINIGFLRRVSAKDVVIFSRQFSVLISANVAMVQALKILADQTANPNLRTIIGEIADEIDAGSSLSAALAKRTNIFSNFFVSVIKSGEAAGKLDEVLNYLADEMEKDYDMMSKIKGAMIYPAFVLCSLSVVGVIMMIFVVPKLTSILTESGSELPFSTKLLIGTSDFMVGYWWLLAIIVAGLVFVLNLYAKRPRGKRQLDLMKLKLPIVGHLFQLIYLVRFTRSMNTLIVGGVTISNSLKVASEVVGNAIFQGLIEETIKEVEDGNSVSSVFVRSKHIPKMVSQMLNIGEKTGKMDIILGRITDFYSREVSNLVANLMTLMEPLIMVLMGLAVGVMVAAIILPMYNMASNF